MYANQVASMKLPIIEIRESIEVYTIRAFNYILGFMFLVLVAGLSFKEMNIFARGVMFLLMGACLWACTHSLRRGLTEKVVLRMNEEGIFYYESIFCWEDVSSYQTFHEYGEEWSRKGLIIVLKNGDTLSIDTDLLDISVMALRKHMDKFCQNWNIIYQGHFETDYGSSNPVD